jgi:hypothetical protein
MWIVGADYYGKVDRVPGRYYVRTRFLHVMFFPFVPTSSYVFLEQPNGVAGAQGGPEIEKPASLLVGFLIAEPSPPIVGVTAHKIRLSLKSITFAWFRALLVVFTIACVGTVLECIFDDRAQFRVDKGTLVSWGTALATLSCGVYLLTLPLSRPGYCRRHYLEQLLAERGQIAPLSHNAEA